MQVSNNKPVILSPIYAPAMHGNFSPVEDVKKTIIEPLRQPLLANHPVVISANGQNLSDDELAQIVVNCCGEQQDLAAETEASILFKNTLQHFTPVQTLRTQELFANQAGTAANLPAPSPSVVYTPGMDIIPTCKSYLAGNVDENALFATFAYYARPETLGFYFANEIAFNDFKAWFAAEIAKLASGLPADTNQLCADFQNLSLNGLTESLRIRNNDSEGNEDWSFPRVLLRLLMDYTKTVSPSTFGCMPFLVGELFCPLTIVFINIEKHAHASASQIKTEWEIINQSLQNPVKMVSNRKLSRMTAVQRNLRKAAAAAAVASRNLQPSAMRAANFHFRKQELTPNEIIRLVIRISEKMTLVARSQNSFKRVKTTFLKPNRRDPDDFNKPGKAVSTKYRPDIHVYCDTSGSISEQNYQDAIQACIKLAKKMNVNLYFNSFSDYMSQTSLLKTKDKSSAAVYAEFQKIHKVTGGTDYEQIWHFINKSPKRLRELSLIITDFEWSAPNRFVSHPKNLYYMPCGKMDWKSITYWADRFCKTMMHIDPAIRKHILF